MRNHEGANLLCGFFRSAGGITTKSLNGLVFLDAHLQDLGESARTLILDGFSELDLQGMGTRLTFLKRFGYKIAFE